MSEYTIKTCHTCNTFIEFFRTLSLVATPPCIPIIRCTPPCENFCLSPLAILQTAKTGKVRRCKHRPTSYNMKMNTPQSTKISNERFKVMVDGWMANPAQEGRQAKNEILKDEELFFRVWFYMIGVVIVEHENTSIVVCFV